MVKASDCLDQVLLGNSWLTEDELSGMTESDKKIELVQQLHYGLDKTFHTFPELGGRNKKANKGGLCGIGALYQALENTVLTKEIIPFKHVFTQHNLVKV